MLARQQIEGFADTDAIEARARDQADDQSVSGSAARLQEQLAQSPMHRMASFAIDDRHLILFRAVTIPGQGHFQQGLLLDLKRFADWIENRVVVESGLARYIQFQLAPIEELGALGYRAERRFIYDHRFDQPFEDLGARLSLTALPDTGGSANIYLMGLLLIAVSTIGLWAMYRRVAVAVHFAERRSNFAAAVSHELKTPLTAIRMYAEMLRDGMVPDEARRREYYGTITSEAERLTRLINNVLEFSNLEKRTRTREITLGRVERNLREVIQILEPHAHSRGFTIKLKLEPDLPAVRFEADALQQILFNLIDNSLKYAEGATRKEIEVAAQAWEGGVRIRVRDYGAGVSAKHRPHLFEPFYRGENELTRRTKGTGIGLALVKGLAEEMNGEIHARNATGGGFEVELRLRE
jgi:signal transduction histidine kinase